MASNHEKRNVFAAFWVNLRTKNVMFHNGQGYTLHGDDEIKVSRLENKPGVPYPWVIAGKKYIITDRGERMTRKQFKKEVERVRNQQREISQQEVSIASTDDCDQCLLDAYEANSESQFAWGAGCATVEGSLLVGGLFAGPAAPAIEAVAAGVFAGCALTSLFGFPDPETVCADYC